MLQGTIIYFMVGFGCTIRNFLMFICAIICIADSAFSFGHLVSIIAGDPILAISLGAPLIVIQIMFSDYLFKAPRYSKA